MALEFGPKLGFTVHGDEGENWYEELTRFLRGMDALMQCTAISHTIGTPPGTPADGDVYLLPNSVSGDWSGHSHAVARWSAKVDVWEFYAPKFGWQAWSDEHAGFMKYAGVDGWVDIDTPVTPPEEEPDPLAKFQAAYLSAYLFDSDLRVAVDDDHAAGSSAVGYKTPYTGKCYFEFEIVAMPNQSMAIGVIDAAVKAGLNSGAAWDGAWFPGGTYKSRHMTANGVVFTNGGDSVSGTAFVEGDRVGIAINLAEPRAWITVNGVGVDGDPAADTGGMAISDITLPLPFVGFMGSDEMIARILPLEADQLHTPSGFTGWIPAGPP